MNPDIIHETYFFKDYYNAPKSMKIITIHDMIHEKFPHFFPKKDLTIEYKKNAIKKADRIICVSNNTKEDLINTYKIDERKVFTVHHGISLKKNDSYKIKSKKPPFILYVGTRNAHKNFKILLNAFCESDKINKNFNLVLFGGGPLTREELELINKYRIQRNKIQIFGGDDNELIELYKNASAYVITSLYEGFGMPILEAMNNFCPVIASNKSSIPEVASFAAEYFDPENVGELKEVLLNVLFNDLKLKEMINNGLTRAKEFSWEKTAKKTLRIYNSI